MRPRRSEAARRATRVGVAAMLLLTPGVGDAQEGLNESGAQSLLLPVGARIVGLGGAGVASSTVARASC
jgi:hypothetical protein